MISTRRQLLGLALLGTATTVATRLLPEQQANASTSTAQPDNGTGNNACNSLLSHQLRPLMGPERQPLCNQFSDHVLLMVNTASRCGFTHQFTDLEALHQRYASQGFSVLGFPSGDFRQELASEEEVAAFCEINYGVTFPMFEKIHVTGEQAHPLYKDLADATGTYPRWNFNKYLIDRSGAVVRHYPSGAAPLGQKLVADIESLL